MTVFELMSKLGAAGIKLWLEEEQLKFKAPKGALSKELKDELVAKKSDVIDFLKATRVGGDNTEATIPVADRRKPQLLSFSQRRMWFIDQLMPANSTFHIPAALFLNGRLDQQALTAAFEQLIERHESLRTVFKTKGEEPIQVIQPAAGFSLPLLDLTDLPETERQNKARELAEKEIQQPFNLTTGPLIRGRLLKLDDNRHGLIVVMHHIISDGWSMEVFVKEIAALYGAARMGEPNPLQPLAIQYTDYAQWQRGWLSDDLLDTQLGYWKKQLVNAPEELVLPFDRPRPAVKTNHGSNLQVDIQGEVLNSLRQLARELDVTLYVLLLAVYKVVLAKWSGQQDLCVGMPVAGRNQSQVESLIGFFVNTLVIRSQQHSNPSIKDFVAQIREQVLGAQAHQDVPLETIVEALNVPRNLAFSPLYQVAFSYSSGKELKKHQVIGGLEIEPMPVDLVVARQDITMMLLDNGDSLSGVIEYNTDLFDRATIETFYRHFNRVMAAFVADINQPVNHIELEAGDALKALLKAPSDIDAVMPLTPLQRDFVLDSIHDPDTARNTVGYVTELPFAVEQNRWHQAVNQVAQNRPNQRIVFLESMAPWLEPIYQGVCHELTPDFEFIDLVNTEVDVNDDSAIYTWARQLVLRPFNVLGGKLLKHWLVKVSEERYLGIASCHHAITDGSSEFIRVKDVLAAYFGKSPIAQSVASYCEFVNHRRKISDTAGMLQFWQQQLQKVEPLGIAARQPGNLVVSELGITGELKQRLEAWCSSQGVSFANLLRSVFALSLRRCYYQAEDIALIEAVAGRSEADTGNAGCYFEFTPALFTGEACDADTSIADLLNNHRAWRKQLHDNVHLSFSARSKVISPEGLEFQFNYRPPEASQGFEVENYRCYVQAIQPDNPGTVKLLISPQPEQVQLRLSYYENEFEGFQLIERLQSVLHQIADGAQNLKELQWLLPAERHKQLEQWQGAHEGPLAASVLELIANSVAKTPENIAIRYLDKTLSYQELDKRSNQIAHWLVEQGVNKGDHVALAMDRSLELPIFILGALKAGGVYVPIDPAYPADRIAYIVADSQAKILVTEQCVLDRLHNEGLALAGVNTHLREHYYQLKAQQKSDPVAVAVNASDRIYVIYTSGSTGKPKGAAVYHQGEVNLLNWYQSTLNLTDADRVLLISAIGFDLTQKNFFAPLIAGATLVLPEDGDYDAEAIADCIGNEKITVINCAPSAFYPVAALANHIAYPFASLRHLVLGGEPIRTDALGAWLQQPGCRCVVTNSYGPTECTDVVAAWQVSDLDGLQIPIGKPIANSQLYVVDKQGRLMPEGATGELCVAGIPVGAGYLNQPELKQSTFSANPYGEGDWYHTGDLVHYRPDGALVYVGRKDFQVKLRGLRIEPGEIDALIKQEDGVEDSLTLVSNDLLVSYLVTSKTIDHAQIKLKLQQQLPAFMVPSAMVELAAWPLTPNGKVDRKALPTPDLSSDEDGYVAPRNDSEQQIADIWCQILKLERVGVKSDFFSIGGHSLLATQVISRIRQQFGVELSVRALFEGPTIEQLVQKIVGASDSGQIDQAPPIEPCADTESQVLSFAQHRLWFIDQLNQGSAEYNMPAAMRVNGPLNIDILDRALTEIVSRHEVLRTNFGANEGEPTLIIRDVPRWNSKMIDLSAAADKDLAIKQQVDIDANKVFDLENDLLLSTTLLKVAENDYVLLINMHHIVSDGWSISIFIQELTTLYQAFLNNQPSPLPDLAIQYRDFAVWQRNWLQDETLDKLKAYWLETLGDAPEVLRLPTDFPRPKQQTFNGTHFALSLGEERTQQVNQFCEQYDMTPFMVLMGAYQILLSRYCHQDDVCVGIPIAGRNRAEIENLIGFFINGLVIRTKLDGNPTVLNYLARVKEAALGAYAHQDMPADVLADTLKLSRSAEHAPGAQVGFALQNTPQEQVGAEFAGLTLTPVYREQKTAKYEFSLILQENEQNIAGVVEYNTDLFKESTVAQMMTHFNRILDQLLKDPESYIDNLEVLNQVELYQALNVDPNEFELFPLSPMQRDQYLDALVEPESLKNSMGYHLITDGEFDYDIWRQAAQKLIDDQPLLRCYILASDLPYTDVAYHCIRKSKTLEMDFIDLSDRELTTKEAQQIAEDWVWRPYDVTKDELTEYRVYKLSGGRHMCCFRMNHLVADGVGMALHGHCNTQVADALKAGVEPPVIPPLFFQHIPENKVRMDKPETLAYWKKVSQNVEALDFSIPPQFAEQAKQSRRIENRLRVSDEHWQKVRAYCQELGVHPSLYFKAIYGMLINVYCRGESDFYMTEVLAGRSGMHKMTFGNYFQLLPVIFPQDLFTTSNNVEELFEYIKNYKRNLRKLADISLLQQRRILPQGRLNFMFNYYNFIPSLSLHGTPIITTPCPQIQDGPIQFVVHEQSGWIELVFIYLSNMFADLRFVERVNYISEQIVNGTSNIRDIEYVLPDEKEQQLTQWNNTANLPAPTATVVDLFMAQAEKTPNQVAVQMGNQQLSYSALNERSNQVAQLLLANGAGKNDRVGICLDRSVDMLVAVFGVLKAGAAYVPMDSHYPSERLAYMIEDSNAPVLLTQQCVLERLNQDDVSLQEATIVCLDKEDLSDYPTQPPQELPEAEDLIYIIYTSGSTGQPKGAAVKHKGEANLLAWYTNTLQLSESDKCLLVSAFGFDLTQKNLFAPLVAGATLVIPDMEQYDLEAIADTLHDHQITVVNCAPSAFYPLAEGSHHRGYPFSSLRYLVLGGEPIRVSALQPWLEHEACQCRLINSYGPTECTDVVAAYQMQSSDETLLPIGKPIQNTQLYVTDPLDKLLPNGVVGELCISGQGVGAGYLNKTELTAEVFKDNPYQAQQQWYRTGDLVRYWPDGNIEYVGRKDFQVKLRGLRIELGEIEAALRKQPGIQDSLTLVIDERLVSYVIAANIDESGIRNKLRAYLPDYMLPAVIVSLAQWPLTPNGKVDRKALPSPDNKPLVEFVAPRNDIEERLANIWSEVLGVEKVGVFDNFFDLGGHSLLAARAVSKFRNEFDVEVPLRALFELHTVADIAEYLQTLLWASESAKQAKEEKSDQEDSGRIEGFL